MRNELKELVSRTVDLLVRGDYVELERMTSGRRLTASEIEQAVREYGGRLIMPPDGQLCLDTIQVRGQIPPTWSVRCDLWTEEEGRSDLSLELTVIDQPGDALIEVDNLHVL